MTNKQQSAFFIAIIFLFTSGIGLVIYRQYDQYYAQKAEVDLETAQTPSLAVEKLATSTTSGWKTYNNKDFSFGFSYPGYYDGMDDVDEYGVDVIAFFEKNNELASNFHVSIDYNPSGGADPLSVIKDQPERIVSGPENFSVAGISAKRYKINWNYEGNQYVYDLVTFTINNKVYVFTDGSQPNEQIFNSILSTFKFIK